MEPPGDVNGVAWGYTGGRARLEPTQARDPVMLRCVERKPGAAAVVVAERLSTEKQMQRAPPGDERAEPGHRQGLFGNGVI